MLFAPKATLRCSRSRYVAGIKCRVRDSLHIFLKGPANMMSMLYPCYSLVSSSSSPTIVASAAMTAGLT